LVEGGASPELFSLLLQELDDELRHLFRRVLLQGVPTLREDLHLRARIARVDSEPDLKGEPLGWMATSN
jgi:hypothetical protein